MKEFISVIIALGLFIGLPAFGIIILERIECQSKANALGYICKYDVLAGCILTKPNGKKVLLEQLREYGD